MKKVSVENNINKYYVVIGSICIVAVIILLIFSITENTKQYLVQSGTLEHTEITTGYIVKKEKTISKDQSKVLVPVVSEGARISKNDIIATYKGEEYKNYEETLSQMDKDILERMQDLPIVYSSEVDAIEDAIYVLVKESVGETSYNKMQEYKQKINTNVNKRANIIGELSPAGAEIKKLIEERNEYEAEAKKSNDNILAPIPGIVSYTTDGLEEKLNYEDTNGLDYNTIKKIVSEESQVDNTKIKVVNNYEAYIVMKASLDNVQYIEAGYNYRLRLIEQNNYEFLASLEKVEQVKDGIEVYFKVTNGIENIVNLREAEIEVVWDYSQGLIVPTETLNKYEDKDIYYIIAIKKAEYQKIPVAIKTGNENYIVVKNYTNEELDEVGLDCEYELQLYDRIILQSKK
ncbi:MAG: hypothetical protein IJ272_01115 [Clostridia bacterium]|nr:hypothetical protein [Clostridia bacterium]